MLIRKALAEVRGEVATAARPQATSPARLATLLGQLSLGGLLLLIGP